MKYMVLTARHHDGFALWDSPSSYMQFDAMHSAAKRDLVAPFVKAARDAGMKVGLYYSPMDWRFPGYFDPKGLPENAALMKKQAWGQIEELTRNYGQIDILWYDGGWLAMKGSDADAAPFWESDKLAQVARLKEIGEWTGKYGEAIYGTRAGPLEPVDGMYGTVYRDKTIYVHVISWSRPAVRGRRGVAATVPMRVPESLLLPVLKQKVTGVRAMTGGKATFEQNEAGVTITLARENHDAVDTIIAMECDAAVGP